HCVSDLLYSHSFPTRRSSDLETLVRLGRARKGLLGRADDQAGVRGIVACGIIATAWTHDKVRRRRLAVGQLDVPRDDHACLPGQDRKSTRLNSSHVSISYAVF